MTITQRANDVQLYWVQADEEILGSLRPDAPFDARASFQAFGERQFGSTFVGVACCCELPSHGSPRWEAALELRESSEPIAILSTPDLPATNFFDVTEGAEAFLFELTA